MTEQPLATGIFLEARVIGVMKFVDDGEVDDKIVCVPADDRNNGNVYKTLSDLPQQLIKQIEFHFNHYKDLKKQVRPKSNPGVMLKKRNKSLKNRLSVGINKLN